MSLFDAVSGSQGLYYLLTGLWSIVSIDTFQRVTGEKTDLWLVKTVGVLVLVVGAVLLLALARGTPQPEIYLLGGGCALALLIIDVHYVTRGVIPWIYLLDAVAELLLVAGWAAVWSRGLG